MKGLTFYKLNSPYPEDRTKNCGLVGQELDENFFNLKSEDIKTGYWEKDTQTLTLERVDGSVICITGITDGLYNYTFSYDEEHGVLQVETPGGSFEVSGFTTPDMINKISTDNSLEGEGTIESPLVVASIVRPGVYRPAIKLIDTINGNKLPRPNNLVKGNRYVTLERISDYGMLYNFKGIKRISKDLECNNSEWRVPSKKDWDGMLNAIELCSEDRNHDNASSNRALGHFAGKFLKSNFDWMVECSDDSDECKKHHHHHDHHHGHHHHHDHDHDHDDMDGRRPHVGVDSYGFSILPAGYGDGGNVYDYFKQRSGFWTNTQLNSSDVYSKRFDYNRNSVYQEAIGLDMQLSLRLVKDYNGNNFNERETINGHDYSCIMMPDINGEIKIWTKTNIAFTNSHYGGILPNSGQGITYSEIYFVNEWTGTKWVKHELKEGESIVLFKGPDGINYGEYRVVNGALRSVAGMVYEEVMIDVKKELHKLDIKIDYVNDSLNKKIDDEVENLNKKIDDTTEHLITAIDDEIARAKAAEAELNTRIDTEVERLDEKIDTEVERALEAESELTGRIDAEVEKLNKKIDDEVERALDAESELSGRIDTEVERLDEKIDDLDTTINERITSEVERLDEKIDAEVLRAETEEARIENNLNEEIQNRIDNDIDKTQTYVFSVNGGLTLLTNDGSLITIDVDGNYGTY